MFPVSRMFPATVFAAGLTALVPIAAVAGADDKPQLKTNRADFSVPSPLSESERKANGFRKVGDRALQTGEFDDAVRAYAQAAEQSPSDPILRLLTGISLTTIRKPDLAVGQFKVACRLTGDDLVASLLLQGALAQTGQADAAQTIYLEAVRRYGKPNGGLDSSQSLARLKDALKTADKSPILHLLIGDAYQIAENLPAAYNAYRKAILYAPGWAKPKINLGLLRLAQNKPADAVKLFEMALARDPENMELQFYRADAQRQAGDLKGAIANYQRIQNKPAARSAKAAPITAQALTGLGQAYAADGRLDDALIALNQARVIAPTDPAPPAALGEVQTKKRDFSAAASNYNEALRLTKASDLFGTRTVLYQALTQTQISGKQISAALQTLDRALREEPESAGVWHRLRGEAFLSIGNQTSAEEAFRASIDAQTDAGIYPLETLAVIAQKGLLDTITAGYRADLSKNGGGFAGGTGAVYSSPALVGRGSEGTTPERETRAMVALATMAQYRGNTADEILYREALTTRRSRATDWLALADAYDSRARDTAKARYAYRKALNTGGLSEAQTERARTRVKQLGVTDAPKP